jgi:acyl-CoA thioesterase FadM
MPDKFIFSTRMQVRIGDVSGGLHLGNHVLVSFLNEALLLCLREFGFPTIDIDGSVFINADLAVIYKSESFHGDFLNIEIAAGNFTRAGCDFYFRVMNERTGKETASAKMGMLFFDYETRKITEVPRRFRDVFGKLSFDRK